MLEKNLITRIKKDLKAEAKARGHGIKVEKHHGSIYGTAGHPDLYGSYLGASFVIEGKVNKNVLTAKQIFELRSWDEDGGAFWGIARETFNAAAFFDLIEMHLEQMAKRFNRK